VGDFIKYVKVHGTVANPMNRKRKIGLQFIADTGAIYTVIPRSIAKRLDLKVGDKRKFKIASGEVMEYPVSEAYVEIEGNGVTSLVALPLRKPRSLSA
jgi:predicted aspartyl protease